jgi:hypothetical protein
VYCDYVKQKHFTLYVAHTAGGLKGYTGQVMLKVVNDVDALGSLITESRLPED